MWDHASRPAPGIAWCWPISGIPASWSYIGACSRGKARAQVALGNTQLRVYHKVLSNPGTPTYETRRGLRWVHARAALVQGNRRATRRARAVIREPVLPAEGPAGPTPASAAGPPPSASQCQVPASR